MDYIATHELMTSYYINCQANKPRSQEAEKPKSQGSREAEKPRSQEAEMPILYLETRASCIKYSDFEILLYLFKSIILSLSLYNIVTFYFSFFSKSFY